MKKKVVILLLFLSALFLSAQYVNSHNFDSQFKNEKTFFLKVKTNVFSLGINELYSFVGKSSVKVFAGEYYDSPAKRTIRVIVLKDDRSTFEEIDYDDTIETFESETYYLINIILIPINDSFEESLVSFGYEVEHKNGKTIITKGLHSFKYNKNGLLLSYKRRSGNAFVIIRRTISPMVITSIVVLVTNISFLGVIYNQNRRSRIEDDFKADKRIFTGIAEQYNELVVDFQKGSITSERIMIIVSSVIFLLVTVENQLFSNLSFLGKLGYNNIARGGGFYYYYLSFSSNFSFTNTGSTNVILSIFLSIVAFLLFMQTKEKNKNGKTWILLSCLSSLNAFILYIFVFKTHLFDTEIPLIFLILFETLIIVFLIIYLILYYKRKQNLSSYSKERKHIKLLFSAIIFSSLSGLSSISLVIVRDLNSRFWELDLRSITIIAEGIHFTSRAFSIVLVTLILLFFKRVIQEKSIKMKTNDTLLVQITNFVFGLFTITMVLSYVLNLILPWRNYKNFEVVNLLINIIFLVGYAILYFILFFSVSSDVFNQIRKKPESKKEESSIFEERYDNSNLKMINVIYSSISLMILFLAFNSQHIFRRSFDQNYEFDANFWYFIEVGEVGVSSDIGQIYLIIIILSIILLLYWKQMSKRTSEEINKFSYKKLVLTTISLLALNYIFNLIFIFSAFRWKIRFISIFAFIIIILDFLLLITVLSFIAKSWKNIEDSTIHKYFKPFALGLCISLGLILVIDCLGLGINIVTLRFGDEQIAENLLKTGTVMSPFISISVIFGTVITIIRLLGISNNEIILFIAKLTSFVLILLIFANKIFNMIYMMIPKGYVDISDLGSVFIIKTAEQVSMILFLILLLLGIVGVRNYFQSNKRKQTENLEIALN